MRVVKVHCLSHLCLRVSYWHRDPERINGEVFAINQTFFLTFEGKLGIPFLLTQSVFHWDNYYFKGKAWKLQNFLRDKDLWKNDQVTVLNWWINVKSSYLGQCKIYSPSNFNIYNPGPLSVVIILYITCQSYILFLVFLPLQDPKL